MRVGGVINDGLMEHMRAALGRWVQGSEQRVFGLTMSRIGAEAFWFREELSGVRYPLQKRLHVATDMRSIGLVVCSVTTI